MSRKSGVAGAVTFASFALGGCSFLRKLETCFRRINIQLREWFLCLPEASWCETTSVRAHCDLKRTERERWWRRTWCGSCYRGLTVRRVGMKQMRQLTRCQDQWVGVVFLHEITIFCEEWMLLDFQLFSIKRVLVGGWCDVGTLLDR